MGFFNYNFNWRRGNIVFEDEEDGWEVGNLFRDFILIYFYFEFYIFGVFINDKRM